MGAVVVVSDEVVRELKDESPKVYESESNVLHVHAHVCTCTCKLHVPQKRALGSYNYFMQLLILSPVFQCSNIENLGMGLGTRLYMHAIPQILLISTMSHILLHYIHVHVHVHSMWHYTQNSVHVYNEYMHLFQFLTCGDAKR